jgi:hypothetical protein
MAGAVADRAWRKTEPERVEADLAALWREIASGDARVARAVMSNLVVFRDRTTPVGADPAAILAGLPLEEVAARHPSRTIVLEHCYGAAPGPPFSAAVGIITFGPPHARYGVEQIVVRSACPDASLLSILRRFVRGDLPTTVWWTADVSKAPPPEPFIEIGRQFLYDSRSWSDVRGAVGAMAAVVADARMDPADLNWRRLAPLQRALVHARGPLQEWATADVRVRAPRNEAALAWLCAGWLRAARRESDRAAVEVDIGDVAPMLTVQIGDLAATLTAGGAAVEGTAAPLSVAARVESDADAIADELRTLARDSTLIGALRALIDGFGPTAA